MKKRLAVITTAIILLLQMTSFAAPVENVVYGTDFNFLGNYSETLTINGSNVIENTSNCWSVENSVANATVTRVNVGTEQSPNYALGYANTNKSAQLKFSTTYWSAKNKFFRFDIRIDSGAARIKFRDAYNQWKSARNILEFSGTGDITVYGSSTDAYRSEWTTGNWYNVYVVIDNSNNSGTAPALIEVRSGSKNGTLLLRDIVNIPKANTAYTVGTALIEFETQATTGTSFVIDNLDVGRIRDADLASQDQSPYPASELHIIGNHSRNFYTSSVQNGTVTVEYVVKDFQGSATTPEILVGAYDAEGCLVGFNKGAAVLTTGTLNKLSFDVPGDATQMRAFVWDTDNLTALENMYLNN